MNEKLKGIIFRLKVFGWYFLTEPIRQGKEMLRFTGKMIHALNKTFTWIYILVVFAAYSLFIGNRQAAGYMVLAILFLLFYWEWERGYFMKVWNDSRRESVKKKIKEDEEKGIIYPR